MSNELANIQPSDESFSQYLDKIYEQGKRIHVPDCKLCNSPLRDEAEEKILANTSVRQIHIWLKERKEDISYGAVDNHLYEHFLKQLKDYKIKSTAESLEKWGAKKQSDEEIFTRYINGMDKTIMRLFTANDDPTLPLAEARKNSEVITKLSGAITELKTQIVRLDNQKHPARIILSTLSKIVAQKVANNSDDEIKKVLSSVMDQLSDEIKHLDLEENG